jgi:hypothetical protein
MPVLPTTTLLNTIRPEGAMPLPVNQFGVPAGNGPFDEFWVVGHCLWSFLAALIGGALAHALFAPRLGPPVDVETVPQRPAGRRWRVTAAAGLASLVTIATLVLILVGARSDPAFFGAIYLLTWGLLGFAVLGFACGQGRRRMVWLGAALFGLGYMILNRGPDQFEERSYVHLVVDQFLISLRPWIPPVVSGFPARTAGIAAENARILKTLDRPIPMPFPHGPPLADVLDYIRAATRDPDGREIPIYVDPVGLAEAEKSLKSPVQIDLTGVPLSTTLRLTLRQLGLTYMLRDGLVWITGESSEDPPFVVDYGLLLGHCLLALLAAGLGATLVPLVGITQRDRS